MSGLADLNVPWVHMLSKILLDGEWHSYEDALEEACAVIPANLAWEKGEYYRSYYYRRRGIPVQPRRVGSSAETIHTGRRIIMGDYIRLMVKRRVVEIEYAPSGGKRRKPSRLRLFPTEGVT